MLMAKYQLLKMLDQNHKWIADIQGYARIIDDHYDFQGDDDFYLLNKKKWNQEFEWEGVGFMSNREPHNLLPTLSAIYYQARPFIVL